MTSSLSNTAPPSRVYGPGLRMDTLANCMVGGTGCPKWSLRFRAEQSSPIVSIRLPFLSTKPDFPYGSGTGGWWRYSLCSDDGSSAHLPSMNLCDIRTVAPLSSSRNGRTLIGWPSSPLVAGTLYHLLIESTEPKPRDNWFSINTAGCRDPDPNQMQPRWPDSDFAMLGWDTALPTPAWRLIRNATPIVDFGYANQKHQGQCYGEANYPYPGYATESLVGHIGQRRMVRERWTHHGPPITVSSVSLRALRSDDAGDLVLAIWRGDILATTTSIPPASIVARHPPKLAGPGEDNDTGIEARWSRAAFDRKVTLEDGVEYSLVLSGHAGTHWTWPMRRLTDYGYSPSTAFNSVAEFIPDGGKTWLSLGRVAGQNSLQWFMEAR